MTEEKIRQNAEEYAIFDNGIDIDCSQYRAYIVGAHSRDEEIKELNSQVALHKDRADYYHDLYMKLRNPWISVEERLPEDENEIIFFKDGRNHSYVGTYYIKEKLFMCMYGCFFVDGVVKWMHIPN